MTPNNWLPFLASRFPLLYRLYREEVVPRRRQYLLAAGCMAVVAGVTAMSAWLMRDVINQIFVSKQAAMLWIFSGVVALLFLTKGVMEYTAKVILGGIGNAITASLRRRFYAHLLRQDLMFFVHANSSQFVAQLIRHIDAMKNAVELVVVSLSRDLLTLVGLVLVMLGQQPVLFMLAVPSALAVIWFVRRLSSKIGAIVNAEHTADVRLISMVQETAQGIRSVKAFNLQGPLHQGFGQSARQSEQRANRINRINALSAPLTESLGGLAIAGVILYGGWRAIAVNETPGEFMAFIAALLLAYEPAKRLSQLKLQLETHLVLARSFYAFLDRQPMIRDPRQPEDLDPTEPATILLHDLSFGYQEGGAPVISELNLSLQPGQVTGICGPTGGGKSTLVDLLFRFHDPWGGGIRIGGHDIRHLPQATLNAYFAYVGQDVFLFDGSIRENIRMGREEVDENSFLAAARAAMVDEFVRELPQGYDTQVGEKGVRLSGGQRQRIAIARALLKQAQMLVLDEATSALDPETEQRLLANMRIHHAGRGMLIVSHRLAPLVNADQIVVLEAGHIVAQGSYEELTAFHSRFSELFIETGPVKGSRESTAHPLRVVPATESST